VTKGHSSTPIHGHPSKTRRKSQKFHHQAAHPQAVLGGHIVLRHIGPKHFGRLCENPRCGRMQQATRFWKVKETYEEINHGAKVEVVE